MTNPRWHVRRQTWNRRPAIRSVSQISDELAHHDYETNSGTAADGQSTLTS